MDVLELLEQARADLAALESDTAKLTENLTTQESALETTRREARAGKATFEAVVKQQGRAEAARGLLKQHHQDIASLLVVVSELEAALNAEQLLAEGRKAHRIMGEARRAFYERATRLEAHVTEELAAMKADAEVYRQGRVRLGTALRQAARQQGADYGTRGDRITAATDHTAGRAWLAAIDPALTEPEVLAPWGGLGLTEKAFPLLVKAGANG